MYDGTLCTKGPWQALVTFQQLIVLADKEGSVDMTPEAIARRTTIPLDVIKLGLEALALPDPESRSPAEAGRRIVPLSDGRAWGWRIVNYDHYRKMRTAEERREYMRQYMRGYRKPQVNLVNVVNNVSPSQPIAVSSNAEAKEEKKKNARKRVSKTPLPDGFSISPRVDAWAAERGHGRLSERLEHFVGYVKRNGTQYADWDEAFMSAIREDWAKFGNGAINGSEARRKPSSLSEQAAAVERAAARKFG